MTEGRVDGRVDVEAVTVNISNNTSSLSAKEPRKAGGSVSQA